MKNLSLSYENYWQAFERERNHCLDNDGGPFRVHHSHWIFVLAETRTVLKAQVALRCRKTNEHALSVYHSMRNPAKRLRFCLRMAAMVLAAVALVGGALTTNSQDTGTNTVASRPKAAAKSSAPQTAAPPRHELSGAELYSIHCNRCHPERYPTERTAAQWKTIMLHMRVRANLPAEQARTILKYLQENSGR